MILRDGRRVSHDLGPRRTFATSDLKMIAWESTGSGKWVTMPFDKAPKPTRASKTERNRQWRQTDLERQRQKERERSARARARKRAAIPTSAPA